MVAPLLLFIPEASSAALPLINHGRELLAERSMAALGTWALLNLVVSGYLAKRTAPRSEGYYFHLMNIGWNMVNVLLAVWGILRAHPAQVATMTLPESLAAQFDFEKILLFNAGLDVAYVCIGSWLRARAASDQERPERLAGFGRSLWLQGGFLFLFDVGLYLLYHPFAGQLLAEVS